MARKDKMSGMSAEEKRALEYRIEEEEKAEATKKKEFIQKQRKLMQEETAKKQKRKEKATPTAKEKKPRTINDSDGMRAKLNRQQDEDSSSKSTNQKIKKTSRTKRSKKEQKNIDPTTLGIHEDNRQQTGSSTTLGIYEDDIQKDNNSEFQPGISNNTTEQTHFVLKNATRPKTNIQSILDSIKSRTTNMNINDKKLDNIESQTQTSNKDTTTESDSSSETIQGNEQENSDAENTVGTAQRAVNPISSTANKGNKNRADGNETDENQKDNNVGTGKASGIGAMPGLGTMPPMGENKTSQKNTTTANNTSPDNTASNMRNIMPHNLSSGVGRQRDNATENTYEESEEDSENLDDAHEPTLTAPISMSKKAVKTTWNIAKKAKNIAAMAKVATAAGAAGSTAVATFTAIIAKIVLTAIIIVLALSIIIGILAFFMNVPGVILDKLTKTGEDMWQKIKGYVSDVVHGEDKPTEKEIEDLAVYLTEQGVQLEEWGFANEFNYDRKHNRVEVVSKYLPVYMAAEERCYLVAKDNISLSSFWSGLKEFASGWFMNWDEISFGNGNIYIDEESRTLLQIRESSEDTDKTTIENKVQVFRKEQELLISRNSINDDYSKNGVEAYRYKLKYWLDKYGTSIHFFMSLHLATMAPEFVYEMAVNPSQGDGHRSSNGTILNTRIDIKAAALEPGKDVKAEIVYVDINPRTKKVRLDAKGMPVMLTVAQIRQKLAAGEKIIGISGNPDIETVLNSAEKFNETDITIFTPYIQRVINHWFYKEVIYQGTPSEGSYAGQKINVYRVEDVDQNDPSNTRYQMYHSIQVPAGTTPSYSGDNTSSGSSGGSSGSSGESSGSSGEGSSGSSGGESSGSSSGTSGTGASTGQIVTGDDRKDIEEKTQILTGSDSESAGGFWNGLMDLIDGIDAVVGNLGGIVDIFLNLPGQILDESFSALSDIFTSVMPSNLISQFSDSLFGGLSSYVKDGLGSILNIGKLDEYLNFDRIASELGIDKLRDFLDPSELISKLGLGEIQDILLDISSIGGLSDIPRLIADKLDMDWLGETIDNVDEIIDYAVNPDLLVSAMYQKLDEEVITKISDEIIEYADKAFNGIDASKYDEISNRLIDAISENLVDQSIQEFKSSLKNDLLDRLDSQYEDVARRLLENENSKQLTGLTIDQLENLNTIPNLDFDTIQEVSKDVEKIEQQIKEGETESQKLSALVNEIAIDYAGIDASTFNNIAKQLRDSQEKIKKASQQIIVFENVLNDYTPDERTNLQLSTNIERAETAIQKINIAIDTLQVGTLKAESDALYKAGTEIKRIVDNNKGKMDVMKAAILLAQANTTENIVTTATNTINQLDRVTIIKFKKDRSEIELQGFLDTADKLVTIDPSLNGLNDTITHLNEKLANANEENANDIIHELNSYRQKIELIEWLTPTEIYELQSQVESVINSVEDVKQAIYSADRIIIDKIVSVIDSIEIPTITSLAEQLISIPNDFVHSLVDTVRNIPRELIESVTDSFRESLASAITEKVSEDLAGKVGESLSEELNANGELEAAMTSENDDEDIEDPELVEEPVEDPENEYLTGFFIKETRLRDYIQKSEPILVPYNFEHWKKLFLENKYLIAGTPEMEAIKAETAAKNKKEYNVYEDKTYIEKYGKTLWEATAGALEESIYSRLQSADSVGSEYLVRYFKELFNEFGDALEAEANKLELSLKKGAITLDDVQIKIKDGIIGWIFKTEKVTNYLNTETNLQIQVEKAEYEPPSWAATNLAKLPSEKTDIGYGFKEDLKLVSPANGIVITKTDKKKNEVEQEARANIVIQLENTGDSNADGMKIIITGGDFSGISVGTTVKKGQEIGVTTTDDIYIMILNKSTHTQVQDITQYINPPFADTTEKTTSTTKNNE